ncbi:MAG: ATP-binding cassette domain-containing protein [Qingshengfaniella sp.]
MREVAHPLVPAGDQVPALIAARGLGYRVAGRRLIDGMDLEIRQGRRTMIMGANGAGKTLLLRLLHGILPPGAGQVLWRGQPLDRAARRQQAMVFQSPVMLRRSVLGNLRFALAVRGIRGAERAAHEAAALRQAQLEDLARRPARVLSGGEQQRLAMVRALALRPEVLFLDEPTASLDPASTLAIEALIDQAHGAGVSIVMVSHDRAQARRLGDDIVFLHEGRVAETGPAAQVLDTPRSAAARAWLAGRIHLLPPDRGR